jgi:hypothetical protein
LKDRTGYEAFFWSCQPRAMMNTTHTKNESHVQFISVPTTNAIELLLNKVPALNKELAEKVIYVSVFFSCQFQV